jgi:hypothetical protein
MATRNWRDWRMWGPGVPPGSGIREFGNELVETVCVVKEGLREAQLVGEELGPIMGIYVQGLG